MFTEVLNAKYLELFPEKTSTRYESDKSWMTPKIQETNPKEVQAFPRRRFAKREKIAKSHYVSHGKCEERLRA